jgi:hypothetical protein
MGMATVVRRMFVCLGRADRMGRMNVLMPRAGHELSQGIAGQT